MADAFPVLATFLAALAFVTCLATIERYVTYRRQRNIIRSRLSRINRPRL